MQQPNVTGVPQHWQSGWAPLFPSEFPMGWYCKRCLAPIFLLIGVATQALAGEIHVAVASNFSIPMQEIVTRFEAHSGHRVIPVFGSTGKHYTQIRNGAPFVLFFAADVEHPRLLEQEGIAIPGSRFTYAVGKLVLWSPDRNLLGPGGKLPGRDSFRYLAIANPQLAPYGKAAQEVLQARGVWQQLQGQMVRGENIAQTYQFVSSGNAQLGFVALSQIRSPGQPVAGSWWEVDAKLYSPIEQQAVLLEEDEIARSFLSFLQNDAVKQLVRGYGYDVP
jgi:molybdate transport system substrate-binding protein